MRDHLHQIEEIARQPEPPTFANTIEAMERSGRLLSRVASVFGAITGTDTNPTLQQVQKNMAPRLAEHRDAIYLHPTLFARIERLYDQRANLDLNTEQTLLVERYHRDFVRAGAELGDAEKTRLRALNLEESRLTTEFSNRLLAASNAGALVVSSKSRLVGFPEAELAAAADAARTRGLDDKFCVPLQNTTPQPSQVWLEDRTTRQELFEASIRRAERNDANDTRSLIQRLAALRAERAELLGYASYAAWVLDEQMAKTPEAAIQLMTDVARGATAKARDEAAKIQALIDQAPSSFELAPWDWQYYAEKVRQADFALDQAQIRPYLEIDRVLHDGVFFSANQLYGLTFEERNDLPVYAPDVRVFEVFDHDGSSLALFYADYWKRDSKRGGAWMDNLVNQSHLLGTRPVVFNVCNFSKPSAGQPALISFDNVTTMFHEFGHALHAMFSDVEYPTLSGTNVPRDFVELPSQFNEHWATEPRVLANYARHYETGAPMPDDLVAKIEKTRTFGQGFATTQYLAAALLDMAWHTLSRDAPAQDVAAFEQEVLERYQIDLPQVPPRYRSSYFAHIWGGGYAAGYYAYLWSEVLDHDAYYWFRDNGGMKRHNGQRFRDLVLSRGATEDVAELYRRFRGRDPIVQPMLEQRGLERRKSS
jgi:peptidyl-dipeptidase Dcp